MANEFVARNGIISKGDLTVSGSISTTSPVNLSGFATGSVLFTSGSEGAITGSSSLTWNNTDSILNLGTTTTNNAKLIFRYPNMSTLNGVLWADNINNPYGYLALDRGSGEMRMFTGGTYFPTFYSNNGEAMRIASPTRNILIGTTTDSGYKLDVNGTFRATVSTETTPFVISHTNGNFATILIGNGSQLAAGQMGMYFNGTPMWTWNGSAFRLPGNILSTASNPVTLQIFGGWGGSTVGTSLRLGSNTGNGGVFTATSGTQSTVEIGNAGNETWSPSSGNATYNLLNLVPRFNTTGTYSGISRGLYYAPTLTSITGLTHRAIETVTGDVLFGTTSGNVGIGTTTPASRLTVSGSAGTGSAIYAYKSGSTVLDIQGSQGQLFSVIDALSGSLMSVNDVSGLPILEVFSDDRVVMGTYGAPALIVTGSNTIISGSLRGRVAPLSIASNTASIDLSSNNFFTITLANGANTYINPTNIQPGQTVNVRVTQGSAGTGTVSFPSFVDQASGSLYTGSAVANAIDIVTMITFDSSIVYISSIRNMI